MLRACAQPPVFRVNGKTDEPGRGFAGMTNRKDMLDEALLRPGRLEVQIEIGLPDEAGRQQILKIHTSKMETNSFLGHDVNLPSLAGESANLLAFGWC